MNKLAVGCLSVVCLLTGACTKSTVAATASTSTTISVATAGQTYLAAAGPVNSTIATFATESKSWTSQTTNTQAESEAQPVIVAIQALQQKLTADSWPASAQADINALVSAEAPLVGDLQALGSN